MTAGSDVAHLLGGLMLVLSFALLARRRPSAIIALCALQAASLAAAAAWQAWIQNVPALYLAALTDFLVGAVALPIALRRRLAAHRDAESGPAVVPTLALGVALVALAAFAVLPATLSAPAASREALVLAVSVVLLGLLLMLVRRTAVGRAVGAVSVANGLILAGISVSGWPMPLGMSGVAWPPGPAALMVLLPLLAAALVAAVKDLRVGGWIVVAAAAASFALSCALPWRVAPGATLVADRLEAHMAMLTAASGLAAAWFSRTHVLRESFARRTHVLLLASLGLLLLAAASDDLGIFWAAIGAATALGALAVGLPRTPHATRTAWKYALLCGVGGALALLGIVFLALAALPAMEVPSTPPSWTGLMLAAPRMKAPPVDLAFVFMLVGFGVMAGLAPLHGWLADLQAEGPTAISAVLGGAMLNLMLIVLLRVRRLLEAVPGALSPGPVILALGVGSVLLAAFAMWRCGDAKRFLGLSTIGQNGLAAAAIGLGGPLATYGALLQITLHGLTKAATGQCVGHAAQLRGGPRFSDLSGLWPGRPMLALTLTAAVLALLGVPPSGLFAARFTILAEAARTAPFAAAALALGLLVGGWALLSRLATLSLGAPAPERAPPPGRADLASAWVLLALVLIAGLAPPPGAVAWLRDIAEAMQ